MSKIKISYIIISLLVVLNAILLIFIISSPSHGIGMKPDRHQNKRPITDIFDLNDAELAAFEQSKSKHIKIMRELNKHIAETSKSYYLSQNLIERDSILRLIEQYNNQFYKANIRHIDELRNIIPEDKTMELERFIHGLTTKRNERPDKPNRPRQ